MKKIILILILSLSAVILASVALFGYFLFDVTVGHNDLDLLSGTSLRNEKLVKQVPLELESLPFYQSTEVEDGILYVGYGYSSFSEEGAELRAYFYDINTNQLSAESTFYSLAFTDACVGDQQIILSSNTATSVAIQVESGQIVAKDTAVTCRGATSVPIGCEMGQEIFRQLLPNSNDQLVMCYYNRDTTLHIVNEAGMSRKLNGTVLNVGGSGSYVVTPALQSGQYLLHHNRSAIEETAVLIDSDSNTVMPVTVPKLRDARPARGFGAGNFGLTLHEIPNGFLADGNAGQVFLLQNNETSLLVEESVVGSLAVDSTGCGVRVLARTDNGIELQEFSLCE